MADAKAKSAGENNSETVRQVEMNADDASVSYTNFCRVTMAPEEVIIDFGLNATPLGAPPQELKINQRVVMNYYNAKRLLHALHHTVQRHEATFGALEVDIQKRVLGKPQAS